MNRNNPDGTKYNEDDPLGLLTKEKEIEQKLAEPNPIAKFLLGYARRRDLTRTLVATPYGLMIEFEESLKRLLGMVVTYELKSGYNRGRIVGLIKGTLQVELKNSKIKKWVDFDEVVKLRKGYD